MSQPAVEGVYIDVVINGEDRTFDLSDTSSLSIGRSTQCTVVLEGDGNVSRKHALVQREDSGEYYLSDLGSRNGTTRNGVPVTSPVLLADGDSFTIGSHRFVFHRPVDPSREEEEAQAPTDVLVIERLITVMVIDIRNYTVLSRELGEARIGEIMNKLFHRAGELLKRNGSWAQKYIGDAVMAFWVHGDGGDSSEMKPICNSLVGLSDLIDELNEEFKLERPLAFGAGINTGLAATGNMGSAAVSDHTAMGDAVNKAFRLETASKEVGREIVLGRSTYELLACPADIGELFSRHTVHLKGYDEPEEVRGLALAELPKVAAALGG